MKVHTLNLAIQVGENKSDYFLIMESSTKQTPIRLTGYADNLLDRIEIPVTNELRAICNAIEEERKLATRK